MSNITVLQSIRSILKTNFKERDALIDAILVGMLSGKNVFAGGPPGTGKSALTNAVCSAVGGKYFYCLMGKATPEDALFGSIDVKSIAESKYRRNVVGMMPDADIAFIDEVFKSSSAVLNSTLSILNERTYKNGSELIKTPLMFAVGASNEIPEAEELAALYDRFTIRVWVDYVQGEAGMKEMLLAEGVKNLNLPNMTIDQVRSEQEAASKVVLSEDVVNVILELRRTLRTNGYEASDRKWVQSLDVVKAYAHLNGRTSVEVEDLEIFEHMLWDDPNDHKSIRSIVHKIVAPMVDEINSIVDACASVLQDIDAGKILAADGAQKVSAGVKRLKKLAEKYGEDKDNSKLKDGLSACLKMAKVIHEKHLGLEVD